MFFLFSEILNFSSGVSFFSIFFAFPIFRSFSHFLELRVKLRPKRTEPKIFFYKNKKYINYNPLFIISKYKREMRERTQKHNNSVRDFGIFFFSFCLSQFLVSLQKGLKRVLNKLPTNLLTSFIKFHCSLVLQKSSASAPKLFLYFCL